ncbi:MAG: glycoside hydrolase family 127 protein [Verrucomicrobia bacterium]|nr:MAG: glycoside hydrolase family 127 protein [Verrucomicrobiota bacterium]
MKRTTHWGLCLGLLAAGLLQAQHRGVIDTSKSPHVALRSINIGDCRWTDGFWGQKWRQCAEVMVPHMGRLLTGEVGHALDNFKIAAGLKQGEFKGTWWHDGDFYKWIEAATYVYAINRDPKLREQLDRIIAIIAKAQAPDGYLSTPVMIRGVPRFSHRSHHELYNMGHLMTAACIHHRVTGQTNFLDVAIRAADYLCRLFGPQPKRLARFGFNQTQITGLVELYRTTRRPEYLRLAELFINMRGRSKVDPDLTVWYKAVGDMVQERVPLRRETEAVGHAVLALYYYAGAADVYAETGEEALIAALDRIWDNIVNRKMYVTGACGQAHHGASSRVDFVHEAFVREYVMPNLTAYNETCANVCNAMFNYRMLGIHGESRFADVMELVLHNSALSGISLDGTRYFYTNPLRRTFDYNLDTTDQKTREPWIDCFCCPPNLVRTIAKSPAWAYSLTPNGLSVNLYGSNHLETRLQDGSAIELDQQSNFPWDGRVRIRLRACKREPFDIWLRIPDWAEGAVVRVNGQAIETGVLPGHFARLKRPWKPGDVIELDMPMETRLLVGNPKIEEIRNQVAIKRGPVVYCLETPDLPKGTSILDAYLPSDVKLTPHYDADFLGGVVYLEGEVWLHSESQEGMYHPLNKPTWKKVKTRFIPYFAWSNRGVSEMTVWLPVVWR